MRLSRILKMSSLEMWQFVINNDAMKVRRHLVAFLALSVPVVFVAANATPAKALGAPVGTYQLQNIYYNKCVTEDGNTGAIYLQACATGSNINHSQLWKFTALGQFVNVHSGLCLIVTGYDPGIWLTGGSACTLAGGVSVAEWNPSAEFDGFITNAHTGDYMDADTTNNGTLIQEPDLVSGRVWSMNPAS